MSQDRDQHSLSVVQAAAKVALYSSPAKQRLANQLLLRARDTNHSAYSAQISLENAAQAAWLSPKELLNQIRDDPSFRVIKSAATATAGGSAHIYVALNVPHIIKTGRSSTRTGFLVEELPPPKGYVLGVHPLRPGQPNCKQFVTFGECAYNERCVFNHPGKQTHDQHKQPITASNTSRQPQQHISPPAADKEPAPPPSKPAWGGAGVPRTVPQPVQDAAAPSTTATIDQQQQQKQELQQQQGHGYAGVASTAAAGATTALGAAAVSSTDRLSSAAGQATAGSTVEQADSSVVQANQHHQQLQDNAMQPPQQQQQAATAVPPRYPPGFGPAAAAPYQGRPCPLMMLRGMCPMGAKCPFDHNTKPGAAGSQAANTTARQPNAMAHISIGAPAAAAAAAAAAQDPGLTAAVPDQSAVSPLAADAQPVTPEPMAAPPPAAAAGPTASSAGTPAAAAEAAAGGTAPQPAGAPAAAATRAPPSSWKALLAGPSTQQQSTHSGPAAAAAAGSDAAAGEGEAGVSRSVPEQHADKFLGWTEGNLPQLRGVANCPFYMGTGACKFRERCLYHHPPAAMHPACVLNGEMPKRYNSNNRPSYARLVNHLYRLWDYDSCVESQLKIWLARHLLDRNNQGTHMFSSTAAKPAIYNHGRGSYGQPLGPYTCAMGEAGVLLHHIWRAQPDEAAAGPMPYTKKLCELLAGDPYFEVVVDPHCASHLWVKLNVDKVKQMLNF